MGRAKHPKPYKDGRTQITTPWKRRVLAALDRNDKAEREPRNIGQLRTAVGAKKGGLDNTLDLERGQLTSAYAQEISDVLGIAPPLIEDDEDDEDFVRHVQLLRTLTVDARHDLMVTAQRLPRRS